MAEDAIQS